MPQPSPHMLKLIGSMGQLAPPATAAQGLVDMWNARQNYLQQRETEKTRRIEIRAQADVEIARIREQAQLVREYFQLSFAERRDNFERSFTLLDAGLSAGNERQIEAALGLIVTLIQESPLKQATETLRQIKERKPGQIIDI